MSSHEPVNDLVYRGQFESGRPDLSGFQDVTLQDIRIAAATDEEQTELRTLVESGWPTDKASVRESVGHTWMFPLNLSQMKDFSISKIVLLFPLHYAKTSCTNYMQLTVAPVLPFATLLMPFSGLV